MSYKVKIRGERPRYRRVDYMCTECELVFEGDQDRDAPDETPSCVDCGSATFRTVSAFRVKRVWGAPVSRGKSDPCPPHILDTQPLGDGMDEVEWKKKLRAEDKERRYQQIKKALG